MEKLEFTYSDSEAGMQSETFTSLSSIVKYIEDFGYNGDSDGIVFQNELLYFLLDFPRPMRRGHPSPYFKVIAFEHG